MMRTFENVLEEALSLELPYSERPPLDVQGIPAAVLLVFGMRNGENALLLTRRTEDVETHKGQMAFPGGHCEPEELQDVKNGPVLTALREAEEEVGLPPSAVRVLGRLPSLWTVTGFWVTPVVGVLEAPVDAHPLRANSHEIAEALWIPLSVLQAPETYAREFRKFGQVNFPIHVYQVGSHRIWGATGSMIKNLLDRLERISSAASK